MLEDLNESRFLGDGKYRMGTDNDKILNHLGTILLPIFFNLLFKIDLKLPQLLLSPKIDRIG